MNLKKRNNEIIKLAKKGASYWDICQKTGVSTATVSKVLEENGAKKRDTYYKQKKEKMLELYDRFNDIGLVANKMGLAYSTVYYHIGHLNRGK